MFSKKVLSPLFIGFFALTTFTLQASAKNSQDCRKLRNPSLNGALDLSMQDCICCDENKKERFVTFKVNTTCESHNEMCKNLKNFDLSKYPVIVNPAALTITQDPPFDPPLAPCQPFAYPPEVTTNARTVVGKQVLVIGGSRGLGKAVADRFYREGAYVTATSRYPECYAKTPYPLKKLDVRFEKDVEQFIKKYVKKHCHIDILVILPGVYWNGPLQEATGDDVLTIYNIKVAGFQRVVHYSLPHMRHSDDTRVISFSSAEAYSTIPGDGSVYAMANIAQERWNDSLQADEMLKKARGLVTFGPTFSLVQPVYVTTSIGLYEFYKASTLKKNSIKVESALVSIIQDQNLSGGLLTSGNTPPPSPTVDEAVFRIAIAPQPGVRYSIPDANEETLLGIPYLEFVTFVNSLPPTDAVNLFTSTIATTILEPEYLEESKEIAIEAFCKP